MQTKYNAVVASCRNRHFGSARKYVSDKILYEGSEGLGSFNKAEPYLKYLEHLNLPKGDVKKNSYMIMMYVLSLT